MSSTSEQPCYQFISDNEQFLALCEQWVEVKEIGIDTEFMRTDTFYPIVGLLQVVVGDEYYLIDPLSVNQFEAFSSILQDETITKILHACPEDIEVLQLLTGAIPSPIFDTQVAAAFVGYGFSIGYQRFVDTALGVVLPKGETRSNWLQRPLRDAQLEYASHDIEYLMPLYQHLRAKLKELSREEWLEAEMRNLLQKLSTQEPFSEAYRTAKSAWKLRRKELAILQRLCEWREQTARQRNKPRNFVVKEQSLWLIARYKPQSIQQLSDIEFIGPGTLRQYGQTLLDIVSANSSLDEDECPELLPTPLPKEVGPLLKALKACVREKAEALDIPTEILVRKKQYEAIVRSGFNNGEYCLPEELNGWRRPLVGDLLLQTAKNFEI